MKTFIWADDYYRFSEHQFYIAQAENVDEARKLLKKQLQSDHQAAINYYLKNPSSLKNKKIEVV